MDFTLNKGVGQLWVPDRQLLYNTVRELKPSVVVESGTWKGGGSTFYIASGIYDNGSGKLISAEPDFLCFKEAVGMYQHYWPELAPYVELHHGPSQEVFPQVVPETIDMVFLDSEGKESMKWEFDFLTPRLRQGGVFMCHDWYYDKCDLFKPDLMDTAKWKITHIIGCHDATDFMTQSVGMLRAVKL